VHPRFRRDMGGERDDRGRAGVRAGLSPKDARSTPRLPKGAVPSQGDRLAPEGRRLTVSAEPAHRPAAQPAKDAQEEDQAAEASPPRARPPLGLPLQRALELIEMV